MLTYVVSSMNGVAFDLKLGSILTVVAFVAIIAVSSLIPNEPSRNEGAH
jgi:hypothetical protein